MRKFPMYALSSETKRNLLSYSITFAIYVPFFTWWIVSEPSLEVSSAQVQTEQISLDLTQFVDETPLVEPTPVATEEEIQEEQVVEEEILEEAEEPKIEEVQEIIPIPILAKKILPSKKPKKSITPKKKPKKKVTKKKKKNIKQRAKSSRKDSSNQKAKSPKKSKFSSSSHSITQSKFTNRLVTRINANKKYPRIAKKRGMEGKVSLRFTINASGKLTQLQARGPRVFVKSAKEAVERSFPISTKNRKLFPMHVNLVLKYRMRR